MKYLASFVFASALTALLAACSMPTTPVSLSADAKDYFFQPNTTFQYTYSQDDAISSSTATYQAKLVDNTYGSYLQLVNNQSTAANNVLYYFKNQSTADGSICILSNSVSDKGFVALKGTLDMGASWYADSAQNVQATVVGKYAEYYLTGRQLHYNDVVVVKYADKNASSDNYLVRYFARDYGLILERKVTGPSSEIVNLQLLSRQGNSSSSNPDFHHDRWYNQNGRYEAHMKSVDEFDK